MAEIYDLDVSAANNNSAPPNGFPENMQYSQVNDSAREQMAVLARYMQAMGAITTTGASNAYILTITQAPSALANGMHFVFKADKTNTGAATLQINALAAAPLRDVNGVALAAGAIVANGIYFVFHDGSVFRIVGSESAANLKTKYESNANTNAFTDAEQTKLAGIEAGATGDQTGAEIKALYEAEADTNAFTDALLSKLNGVESGATADQTGAEIKALYEAEANTNAFTDAEQTKLAGIEAGATADQTATDIRGLSGIGATEALQGIAEIATQAEVNTGTDDTRIVTPAKLAAYSGLPSAPQFAIKTADETVNNSATLQNDNHLVFSNVPTGWYRLDARLLVRDVAVSNCGFKFDFNSTGISGGTLRAASDLFSGASSPSADLIGAFSDTFNFASLDTGSGTSEIIISGYIDITSGTNSLTLQWAQNTAQVGDLTVESNSFVSLTRLGAT